MQTIFVATIDSFMDYLNPTANWGTHTEVYQGPLYVAGGKASLYRGIGNFDVSSIASKTIISAFLRRQLQNAEGAPYDIKISRCTRPSTWTETGVTWNKYDWTNNWTSGGGDFDDTTPAAVTFTETAPGNFDIPGLKNHVTDAIANRSNIVSLILRNVDENPGVTKLSLWYSSESTIGTLWSLVVEWDANSRITQLKQAVNRASTY